MSWGLVRCPECEGTGKAVNHFDLPKDIFDKSDYVIDNKMCRSDGREFLDYECPICGGKGIIIRGIVAGTRKII